MQCANVKVIFLILILFYFLHDTYYLLMLLQALGVFRA